MKKYPIHKDFRFVKLLTFPVIPQAAPIAEAVLGILVTDKTNDRRLKITKTQVEVDGGKIDALIYEPNGVSSNAPALVYFHGGGFIYKAAPYHYSLVKEYCVNAACKVIMCDYRLCPKHPYPTPFNDCVKTLNYVIDNADTLGIDKNNIVVGGDSAGGCLAAGICQYARDNGINIKAQMLVYPAVDRSMSSNSMKEFVDTPVWNGKLSKKMWPMYIPNTDIPDISYASPLLSDNFSNLPPAYIETAEFDSLRDEGIMYSEKLKDAGCDVILNKTKSTMHGFDMALKSNIVIESIGKRCDFLRKSFR